MKGISIKREARNLRKALQAKEELQRLIENLDRLRDSGQIQVSRYSILSQEYQGKMSGIVPEIARIKGILSTHLQSVKQKLNTLKSEIEVHRADYNSGRIGQASYMKAEKTASNELQACREEIERLSLLVNAKMSVEADTAVLKQHEIPSVLFSRRWVLAVAIGLPLLIAALTTAFVVFGGDKSASSLVSTATENKTVAENKLMELPPSPSTDLTIVGAIEQVKPSVVFILTKSSSPVFKNGESYSYNSGSGTVIDKRGYILTNEHVVHGNKWIKVFLPVNGEVDVLNGFSNGYDAKVVWGTELTDIAIIKIDAYTGSLTPAKVGTSSTLKDGEDVAAIGYPLVDLLLEERSNYVKVGSPTVTKGSVSAQRTLKGVKMIQTDTPFNSGNSGGALINIRGELIGIPTKASQIETIQNLNFAIAIDYAKPFIERWVGK